MFKHDIRVDETFLNKDMLYNLLIPEVINYKKYIEQDFKFIVIGFGKMGLLHSGILNLLKPNCVKCIIDKNHLLIFSASKFIKNIKFYRSIDKILKEEDNVIYVTTPTQSHYDIVSKLLDNGIKYIFIEKPPTINFDQLNSLINKLNANQIVMVGLQKRFALPFKHAKLLISEKVIGDIEKVSAYIKSSDIIVPTNRFNSLGKGVLLDLGIHLIDLLVWMLNINVVEYSGYKRIYTNVDDYFDARLITEDNVKVNIEVTWSSLEHRLPETYIEIHGSEGILIVTEDYLKVKSTKSHQLLDYKNELIMFKPYYYQGIPPVNLADPEYTLEDMHFLYSIYSLTEPLTSLRNVSKTMKLIDELYKKALENG